MIKRPEKARVSMETRLLQPKLIFQLLFWRETFFLYETVDTIASAGKVEEVHIWKYSDNMLMQLTKSEAAKGQYWLFCGCKGTLCL